MPRTPQAPLLPGEWACLGLLYPGPTHGFAVASRLRQDGDIGRVWSLSRPLTYRSLDQLVERAFAEVAGEEPGIAGGNRRILRATRTGRAAFRTWMRTPVEHLRDLRSELLLKLVFADECQLDISAMLARQRAMVAAMSASLADQVEVGGQLDVVALWRSESSQAALRFLDRVTN